MSNRNNKNAYTAKIAAVTEFSETNSLSLLMVLKTQNGQVIEDVFCSKSIPATNPVADLLDSGTEIAFEATGRSAEPIRELSGGAQVYAISGMNQGSLSVLLPSGKLVTEETLADETKSKRGQNMAARAHDWILNWVKSGTRV